MKKGNEHYLEALKEDLASNYFQATIEYEASILSNEKDLRAYINLAFIYWESKSQFVFTNGTEISLKFKEVDLFRYAEILELGLRVFPSNTDLIFLQRYFKFAALGEDFSLEECIGIINKYGESELPYFYLYLFEKVKYKSQRDGLLEKCEKERTAKNNWIKSLIEN